MTCARGNQETQYQKKEDRHCNSAKLEMFFPELEIHLSRLDLIASLFDASGCWRRTAKVHADTHLRSVQ